eukprot:4748947-Pyramimonas_sp.AAC.1
MCTHAIRFLWSAFNAGARAGKAAEGAHVHMLLLAHQKSGTFAQGRRCMRSCFKIVLVPSRAPRAPTAKNAAIEP